MITKKHIIELMREIIKTRTQMDYTTLKEDLFKRVNLKFSKEIAYKKDLILLEECYQELLRDGEIFEKFKDEVLYLL